MEFAALDAGLDGKTGWMRFVVSHPCRKNKDAARMGHPDWMEIRRVGHPPTIWSRSFR